MKMRKLANNELNRMKTENYKQAEKNPVIVVLDNVRSMHNIGSVFRTADAFLIEALYLCGITATPPSKEIHKTALGATDSVDWIYFNSTLEAIQLLREKKYRILAVEQADKSIKLQDFNPEQNRKIGLIFGNEINGVDEHIMELVDDCIEIPQFGTKHSLNIAVSAGIVIWDIYNKINKYC